MSPQREKIIKTFSAWTALSALRSGAPVKSKADVYKIIESLPFCQILNSPASCRDADQAQKSCDAFELWHRAALHAAVIKIKNICGKSDEWGWAAKIINVYLKTAVYVGDLGPLGLRECLHPPIDGGLWKGLCKRFPGDPLLKNACCVKKIKDINSHTTYSKIISGLRVAAQKLNCTLFEVEQLWIP